MYNLDWNALKHEIVEETVVATIRRKVINLPDNLYTCPFCKGVGEIRIGNLFKKCLVCRGSQIILPCKTCGEPIPNDSYNAKNEICSVCY